MAIKADLTTLYKKVSSTDKIKIVNGKLEVADFDAIYTKSTEIWSPATDLGTATKGSFKFEVGGNKILYVRVKDDKGNDGYACFVQKADNSVAMVTGSAPVSVDDKIGKALILKEGTKTSRLAFSTDAYDSAGLTDEVLQKKFIKTIKDCATIVKEPIVKSSSPKTFKLPDLTYTDGVHGGAGFSVFKVKDTKGGSSRGKAGYLVVSKHPNEAGKLSIYYVTSEEAMNLTADAGADLLSKGAKVVNKIEYDGKKLRLKLYEKEGKKQLGRTKVEIDGTTSVKDWVGSIKNADGSASFSADKTVAVKKMSKTAKKVVVALAISAALAVSLGHMIPAGIARNQTDMAIADAQTKIESILAEQQSPFFQVTDGKVTKIENGFYEVFEDFSPYTHVKDGLWGAWAGNKQIGSLNEKYNLESLKVVWKNLGESAAFELESKDVDIANFVVKDDQGNLVNKWQPVVYYPVLETNSTSAMTDREKMVEFLENIGQGEYAEELIAAYEAGYAERVNEFIRTQDDNTIGKGDEVVTPEIEYDNYELRAALYGVIKASDGKTKLNIDTMFVAYSSVDLDGNGVVFVTDTANGGSGENLYKIELKGATATKPQDTNAFIGYVQSAEAQVSTAKKLSTSLKTLSGGEKAVAKFENDDKKETGSDQSIVFIGNTENSREGTSNNYTYTSDFFILRSKGGIVSVEQFDGKSVTYDATSDRTLSVPEIQALAFFDDVVIEGASYKVAEGFGESKEYTLNEVETEAAPVAEVEEERVR